jgi:hypothetical protein
MVGFFCADLDEIRPVWKNFGQLGRYSTKIGGGNSSVKFVLKRSNARSSIWLNIVQVGRNSTHGWFFMRQFGRNSTSLENFRPILALVRPKSVVEIKLRAFDQNKITM